MNAADTFVEQALAEIECKRNRLGSSFAAARAKAAANAIANGRAGHYRRGRWCFYVIPDNDSENRDMPVRFQNSCTLYSENGAVVAVDRHDLPPILRLDKSYIVRLCDRLYAIADRLGGVS